MRTCTRANLLKFEIVVFALGIAHFVLVRLFHQRSVEREERGTEWRHLEPRGPVLCNCSQAIGERQERQLENNSWIQTAADTEQLTTTPEPKPKKEPGWERWKVGMWEGFDFKKVRFIRESIVNKTNVSTHWYCSRDNMPLHSTFQFYDGKQVSHKETRFPDKLFRTCSVVGNGGILSGRGCGGQIDSAEHVFRYDSLNSDVGRQNFTAMLDSYLGPTDFYTHPFYNINSRPVAYRALRVVRNLTDDGKTVLWSHPDFLRAANTFWRETGRVKVKRITSGLLVVTIALSMCEETHLYGFWPFDQDLDGNPLNYHYYDRAVTLGKRVVSQKNQWRVVEKNRYHKMKTEHDRLARLHEMGVVRMHVGTCDVTGLKAERNVMMQKDVRTQTERRQT
ncbi:PREDICTED: alpha-N-acetylneuraminide alpha-2,8-sialyltransferase-like [Branchiostoma belcheri]|uniref:Alpha-N-acetylneuraminide alpha-2,8-sialyltransferase-like n=1 Tax=Branchiostoma belcheri TaxID=7741 RepID=A0A6P4ZC74_BRABE|nr:PREDICTED: alpha-N-acetylneuraminide alpha-2,8-sialyltransferase-like [Branchiostoma belcheri]